MDLSSFFDSDGPLARAHADYERRDGQIALALAIGRAFAEGAHLDAEAPAGTGKSFAYLVPLIDHALTTETPAIVVTANIALQEQLMNKDLPMLARAMPRAFTSTLLKGMNNYLCLDRFEEADEGLFDADPLHDWARATQTGDRSELEDEPRRDAWRRICGVPELCTGSECDHFDRCFVMAARDRARRVSVVVTNYHLLFSHLRIRRETGESLLLPDFDAVVCDEAHEMADIAREFFGHRLTPFSIRMLQRGARVLGRDDLMRRLKDAGDAFFDRVEAAYGSARYKLRLRRPIEGADLAGALSEYLAHARRLADALEDEEAGDPVKKCVRAAESVDAALKALLAMDESNHVYFIERDEETPVLRSMLVDAGDVIREELHDRTPSVVTVSATLQTAGSFAFFAGERGGAGAATLAVPSPFDFARQCLLVVPDLGVAPNHADFAGAMAGTINRIITGLGGRTMALFTSYRNLDVCATAARDTGVTILRQGDRPRTQLLDRFRKGGKPKALFATTSFWQGVDIPGDPLSCVIIDKIPFAPPDEPLMEAMGERLPDAFSTFSLPRAIIDLRQGFGRLIRTQTDRGAVVIFDGRIFTKPYGRSILDSLPECERTRDVERIFSFVPKRRRR